MDKRFTITIGRERKGYVALCPELDIANQGDTVENAHDNLREAVALFLETAPEEEIRDRIARARV